MIKVEKEPIDFTHKEQENCCFCRKTTVYWFKLSDVAVCPDCAKIANPEDVPAKSVWCRRERIARGIASSYYSTEKKST